MTKLYIDTETVGLMGPVKLIQYSVDRGPVKFIKLPRDQREWDYKLLSEVYRLLMSPDTTVIGYNLSFDLFKLYQLKHVLDGGIGNERKNISPPFLCKTLDLYTHAVQYGPFAPWAFTKKTGRRVVLLRRVPRVVSELVGSTVETEVSKKFPRGVKMRRSEHKVHRIEKGKKVEAKDLVTLSWITQASNTLKALYEHYTGTEPIKLVDVWPLPKFDERPWLPYVPSDLRPQYDAVESECDTILAGDDSRSEKFFEYAGRDITSLWPVEDGLARASVGKVNHDTRPGNNGPSLVPSHHDSCVAAVAYARYAGFALDLPALRRTRDHYATRLAECERTLAGTNLRSSRSRLQLLQKYAPEIRNSSKGTVKDLRYSKESSPELKEACAAMMDFGAMKQRLDQVEKLLACETGRGHPDLRVMGTATRRMAGTAGLNWQGIAAYDKKQPGIGIRAALLAKYGGDFASFEVAIAASAWKDRQMLTDLDNDTDIHTAVMCDCHPEVINAGLTYDEAIKAKDDESHEHHALIKRCRGETKRITFGILYGAAAPKIVEVLGAGTDGQAVLDRFFARYKESGAFRKAEERRFLTADVERWQTASVAAMARVAPDLTGAVRHFDFEADVADALWRIGRDLGDFIEPSLVPAGSIVRTPEKGVQTIRGAIQSAFLGAALAIQQAVCRAAINTPIQMSGGNLCKMLMAEIWEECHLILLCIHDELLSTEDDERIDAIVVRFIETWKNVVKHIAFDDKRMTRWSDK